MPPPLAATPPGRSTSRVTPPGGGASSSAARSRPGAGRLSGADPAQLRVRGRISSRGWARHRDATGPVSRPRRPHSRPALRFHLQPRPGRLDHVRRRRAAAPPELRGKVFRQDPERGGRPSETLQVGAELLGAAASTRTWRSCGSRSRSCARPGSPTIQLNLGHAGVLAPGLATLDDPLRAEARRWIDRKDRAALTQALGPRRATREAWSLSPS